MNILILEPYWAGSHASWAEEYARRSAHRVEVMSLEGRHWKWRMHGGAVTLARRFLEGAFEPDIIIASDMLDLTTFLSLAGERTRGVKTVLYFHENQISYPWSENDPDPGTDRDAHYGFINIVSALAADAALFNSRYHHDSFLGSLKPFLESFPDHRELDAVERIRRKSRVLLLGLDLERFDRYRPSSRREGPPLILWNHRWEYDKNPEEFFHALILLNAEGIEFEVAVLGERFARIPPTFAAGREELGDRIVQFGFEGDFGRYAEWLWRADILPVTSMHDFFGASVVQALYCDCCPLLPRRLAYREHVPVEHHDEFFYSDFDDLLARLRSRIENIAQTRAARTQDFVRRYDWKTMVQQYDELFQRLTEGRPVDGE
jgi:glycosyltransferase involved in cell wall biosynthesis